MKGHITIALALLLGLPASAPGEPVDPMVSVQQKGRRSQPVGRSSGRTGALPGQNKRTQGKPIVTVDIADEYQLEAWFAQCDQDGNEWISYYEANRALTFGRGTYRSFDLDLDGRFTRQEFEAYYRYAFERGEFRAPRRGGGLRPPNRTPQQLLMAYDADLNGGISKSEAKRILADYSRVDVDADTMFTTVDRDESKLLDISELTNLSSVIKDVNQPKIETPVQMGKTLDEFFIQIHESPSRAVPPKISGPITTFRRLDLDGDGTISPGDLMSLQRATVAPVRAKTILHTLDTNQDGVLDREEFLRSMEPKKL